MHDLAHAGIYVHAIPHQPARMEHGPDDDVDIDDEAAAIAPPSAPETALAPFVARGLVTEVLYPIKSGKEATVYCCRAGPAEEAGGARFLAAKVYRERRGRSFKNDAVYQEGRWHWARNTRVRRAFRNRSAFSRWVMNSRNAFAAVLLRPKDQMPVT